jgi:Arc/MetJ-type ribon-helix-helix transcriptional regulator
MKKISFILSDKDWKRFDSLIKEGEFQDKDELIRHILQKFLKNFKNLPN